MPTYTIRREVKFEVTIEAPTEALALEDAKDWGPGDWGYEDEEITSMGEAPAGTRPDYTLNLRGVEHEHDYDNEDTGGCIYCDARPPATSASTQEGGAS